MVIDGHLMVISPNVSGHFVNLQLCFKRTFTEIIKSTDGTKSQCWVTMDPQEASLSCQVSWFRDGCLRRGIFLLPLILLY